MTGVFILLMTTSLFLSPRDISLEFALLDRVFFALILIIASFFIKDYVSNVEELALSEERYRHLIEWLPEGIIVYLQEKITYVNPAAIRLLGSDSRENLIGRDIIDMIDPGWQAIFRERAGQAALGAQMNIDKIQLIRNNGSTLTVGISLGAVSWDKTTAVQIVMRKV